MKKIHIADHTESSMTPVLWADAVMSNMSAWWRLLSDHGYMKCFTDLLNSLHIHIKCSLFFTWVCLGHKSLRVSVLKFCARVSQVSSKNCWNPVCLFVCLHAPTHRFLFQTDIITQVGWPVMTIHRKPTVFCWYSVHVVSSIKFMHERWTQHYLLKASYPQWDGG